MKHTKIFISFLALSTFFGNILSASAQTLVPSLYAQMQRQEVIDREYAEYKVQIHNEARMEEIRRNTLAREAERYMRENNWEIPKNTLLPSTETTPATTPTLDPVLRAQALARPVTRSSTPLIGSQITPVQPTPTYITPSTTTVSAPTNIDMNRVSAAWLGWVNNLRQENNLAPYTLNGKLHATAQEWSEFSKNRGYITHARPGDGCTGATNYTCYNFQAIDNWFKERGVNPKIIGRSKHTENLGINSFSCKSADCTDAAINAIKKTYNFFLSEKSYNGVHYRTMVSPNFTQMGLGLSVANGKYYLTIHYTNDF